MKFICYQLPWCSAWKYLRAKSSTSAPWKSQFKFILHTNRKQPNLTCRVAWRPSKRTCWPLQHLIWYCCAVRPKSSDAAMASWFSVLAGTMEAAAICSLSLAILSTYSTFIVFLYLCVCVCVFLCTCPFFLSSFLPSSISYLLTIWHHSFYIIL